MITARQMSQYRKAISNISNLAQIEFNKAFDVALLVGLSGRELEDYIKTIIYPLVDNYGNAASIVAREFYISIRIDQIGGEYLGKLSDSINLDKLLNQIDFAARHLYTDGDVGQVLSSIMGIIDKDVKMYARETITQNGTEDRANVRYARVPTGSETCAWCILLASRGFVYRTPATAGELSEYHPYCDCQVVPSFEAEPSVEGYDPDVLYDKYMAAREEAGSGNIKDIAAQMRRDDPTFYSDGVRSE